jgi:DNA-binding NarL/FixJ family response regulator
MSDNVTDQGATVPEAATVLIVDDHLAFAESLSMAIGLQQDLEAVGAAATFAQALERIEETAPDVVIMDVRLPDADGIEGTRRIKELYPATRVLVLTAFADLDVMARAADAGACGFLPKESPVAEILRAIRTASDGGMLVDHSTLLAVLERVKGGVKEPPEHSPTVLLTGREREVLALMGTGRDPRAIAKDLGISIHTCRGHVKSILAKLGAHSQLEAVVVAARKGLIEAI